MNAGAASHGVAREPIVVERVFHADANELFRAWVDPERLRRWLQPIEGVRAAPLYAAYAAAKAGAINFTQTLALELAPHRIRVNAIAPDLTDTEGLRAVMPAGQTPEGPQPMVPMGRAGHVDEVAGAALFLASELSTYLTGDTLHVDGGTHAAGGWYHHPKPGAYILGPPR